MGEIRYEKNEYTVNDFLLSLPLRRITGMLCLVATEIRAGHISVSNKRIVWGLTVDKNLFINKTKSQGA
tara:strand:+ start:450 stop:656 length:207 start_codon:yes stop_codon:yes gene_type:complete